MGFIVLISFAIGFGISCVLLMATCATFFASWSRGQRGSGSVLSFFVITVGGAILISALGWFVTVGGYDGGNGPLGPIEEIIQFAAILGVSPGIASLIGLVALLAPKIELVE